MTTQSVPAGATLFAEAIRVTKLDANGVPVWGASSCVQTKNVVSLQFSNEMQTGADVTKTNGRSEVCLSYKAQDTKKRVNVTLAVCDDDLFMKQLIIGGLLFLGAPVRTVTDGHTTSASAVITSPTAAFSSDDVGASVTGTGVPTSTTILSVQSATQATMSANATATGSTVSLTFTGIPEVEGYQGPKVGEVGNRNGVSVELWARHVVGDTPIGYEYWAFPRLYFAEEPGGTIGDAFMDMNFVGWGNENPNWGSGPAHEFDHDSSGTHQYIYVDDLPSPLADGYRTISAS